MLHDHPGTVNYTWNKAGLVYRATPSDGHPIDAMLEGAGSQQVPKTEMLSRWLPMHRLAEGEKKTFIKEKNTSDL